MQQSALNIRREHDAARLADWQQTASSFTRNTLTAEKKTQWESDKAYDTRCSDMYSCCLVVIVVVVVDCGGGFILNVCKLRAWMLIGSNACTV